MGGIIPKAALGRGLGTLMKKPDAAPITLETGTTQTLLSPGMATLLRGNGSAPNQPGSEIEEPEMTQEIPAQTRPNPLDPDELATRRLYQCSLILADVLLIGLATWIALGPSGRFGAVEALLCCVATLTGAWLFCLALWME